MLRVVGRVFNVPCRADQHDVMPHYLTGYGMLAAGGFCYGRLVDES